MKPKANCTKNKDLSGVLKCLNDSQRAHNSSFVKCGIPEGKRDKESTETDKW